MSSSRFVKRHIADISIQIILWSMSVTARMESSIRKKLWNVLCAEVKSADMWAMRFHAQDAADSFPVLEYVTTEL